MSTVDSLWIRFEGPTRNYTFSACELIIPDHDGPFHALPADTRLLIRREKSLFINGPGARLREQVELDEARRWGYNDEASVIFARASRKYCIRFIFNAAHVLENTQSPSYRAYERLIADAKFHSFHLDALEGRVAPRHYGMWFMDTGNWAGKVYLSITDHGGVSWNDLEHTGLNTLANRQQIGRALELMHDAGINHGDMERDLRHVLLNIHDPDLSPDDILAGRVLCYFTGFSAATTHKCTRKLPVVPLDAWVSTTQVECPEIRQVLYNLDFMPPVKPHEASVVTKALQWYENYTQEYSEERAVDIRIAQRAQFFKESGQVYPDIHIEFVSGSSANMPRVRVSLVPDNSLVESVRSRR